MGGVCAMCLAEQLSSITRSSAETGRHCLPQSTDPVPPSFGFPARLAGKSWQSMDSKGNPGVHKPEQAHVCARRCQTDDDGMQEMSARNSSAGSEQSIASLIERDIDQARQRYSDVATSLESSTDGHAPCTKQQQLMRSRSYSASSHVSSKQSTPARYGKSDSVVLPNCGDEYKFRRCNTVRGAEIRSGSGAPLLAKSKSTGASYNCHANKVRLCSPASHHQHHHHRVWNLPKFWHRKFIQTERRHSADASSATQGLSSSSVMQADDLVPLTKMSRSHSMSVGARESFKSICDQIRCIGITKWLTSSSFHRLRRSPLGKASSPAGTGSQTSVCNGSHACGAESLFFSNGTGEATRSPCTSTEVAQMQNGREIGVTTGCITDEGAAAAGWSTCSSRVEYARPLYSGTACANMLRMQPVRQEDCQSIAALVSMDAHLIHH